MFKKLFLVSCFLLCTHESSGFLELAWQLGKVAWKLSSAFGAIKSNVDGSNSLVKGAFLWEESENVEVLNEIGALSLQLSGMEQRLTTQLDAIVDLINDSAFRERTQRHRENLRYYMEAINDQYIELQRLVTRRASISRAIWKKFANDAITVVESNLRHMRSLLIARSMFSEIDEGFIMNCFRRRKSLGERRCKERQSFHQFIARIIDLAVLMEIQGLTVLSVAYPIQFSVGDSADLIATARKKMEERYLLYLNTSVFVMKNISGSIISCDPPNGTWVRGNSYIEMERLDQILLIPEDATTYLDNCGGLKSQTLADMRKDVQNLMEECIGGELAECVDFTVTKCPNPHHVRRYKWFSNQTWTFGTTSYFGVGCTETGCPACEDDGYKYAACRCSCRKDNENFVSLMMLTSETENNMVVTGVRLKRVNKVLWIQLRQGKLLPNGAIDASNQTWVPIPSGNLVQKQNIAHFFKHFVITNRRKIDYGWVLTGARFAIYTNNNRPGISIVLQQNPVDLIRGIVHPNSIFLELEGPDYNFNELKLRRRNSIYNTTVTVPDKFEGWIELQRSELEHDVGQSMLPLFDSQEVLTDPPSPLGGIGMYHKGLEGYAGFIGLQLHPMSYKARAKYLLANHVNGSMFQI